MLAAMEGLSSVQNFERLPDEPPPLPSCRLVSLWVKVALICTAGSNIMHSLKALEASLVVCSFPGVMTVGGPWEANVTQCETPGLS